MWNGSLDQKMLPHFYQTRVLILNNEVCWTFARGNDLTNCTKDSSCKDHSATIQTSTPVQHHIPLSTLNTAQLLTALTSGFHSENDTTTTLTAKTEQQCHSVCTVNQCKHCGIDLTVIQLQINAVMITRNINVIDYYMMFAQ